ncbi:MAG: hypothetical protein SF051_15865 [Elusimicrobiota bacterium]|nr:hypothetical protein [Elusimicrobiota bacterium]
MLPVVSSTNTTSTVGLSFGRSAPASFAETGVAASAAAVTKPQSVFMVPSSSRLRPLSSGPADARKVP